jgi:hypothetical protein
MVEDSAHETARATIGRFEDPDGEVARFCQSGHSLEEAIERFPERFKGEDMVGPNLLLDTGITALLNLLMGTTAISFGVGNARLGIGDSTTAALATQTGLLAATNHYWQIADTGFPTVLNQTLTVQATVGPNTADYAWNEFVVDNFGSSGSTTTPPNYGSGYVALTRLVSAGNTKPSTQTWVCVYALTFS